MGPAFRGIVRPRRASGEGPRSLRPVALAPQLKREPLGGFDPTRATTADRFTEETMPTLLLIAFLLASPGCLFAQRSAAPSPIIDVHLHAVGMFYRPDGTPPPRVCIN